MYRLRLSVYWLTIGAVAYATLAPRSSSLWELVALGAFFLAAALVDLGDA